MATGKQDPHGHRFRPLDWAKCGSEANYQKHLRIGERPCPACAKAAYRASHDRRERRKQKVGVP